MHMEFVPMPAVGHANRTGTPFIYDALLNLSSGDLSKNKGKKLTICCTVAPLPN